MKSLIALVLLIAVTVVTAQDGNTTTPAPTTAAPTTAAPTTVAPTTAAPTTAAPTTAAPTTAAPTTAVPTTAAPTTAAPTTAAPTTEPDQNDTTTATTASTTPKPVVTTPADNHTVNFHVKDGNIVCILFKSDVKMSFSYKDDSNKTREEFMYLPTSATAKGSCNGTQSMTIMYGKDNANMLTLMFGKDKDNTFIQNISLTFTMDSTFPGINATRANLMISNNKPVFKGTSGHPYLCNSAINTTLSGTEKGLSCVVTTQHLEYDAYRIKNDTTFGENYVNCPEDSVTSNIVPIAVGAALAALVVIVLIAYLISRNRTKRGYESV